MSRAASSPPPPRHDWAYFFDIDGTLVEASDTPDTVFVDEALRDRLEQVYATSGGALAVISGRSLADVDRLFEGFHLPAAGQHGVERRSASGQVTNHATVTERLAQVRDQLVAAVAQKPGLWLEDKGMSLALHYRRAPRLASWAHRTARSQLSRLGRDYVIQTGKRIVELKPAGRDKGAAILEFMHEPPFCGRTPVFVGDDATDEYGFATVNKLRGYSIKVGGGRSVARWRLRDVRAVRRWLES